jgi:hypothetical protein
MQQSPRRRVCLLRNNLALGVTAPKRNENAAGLLEAAALISSNFAQSQADARSFIKSDFSALHLHNFLTRGAREVECEIE